MRKLLAYGAIYIFWGGSFLAIREIVLTAAVPPFLAAAVRFLIAGFALLLWTRLTGPLQINARQFLSASVLGLIMFACDYASLFWGETRVASGLAAVIFAMIPVWIFAGELLLGTQRATPIATGGIALGFAGVILLSLRSGSGPAHSSTLAVLAMIGGTLTWSVGTLWSRHMTLPRPNRANAGLQMFTGGFFLLLAAAAAGEFHHIPSTTILLSARVLLSMAYLIIAASIVSYTAYVWLLTHDSATRVSSYAYINPVFALLLGAIVAGERLTPLQMAGAVLVLAGVFATLMGKRTLGKEKEPVYRIKGM